MGTSTVICKLLNQKHILNKINKVSELSAVCFCKTPVNLIKSYLAPEDRQYELGNFTDDLKPYLKKKRLSEIEAKTAARNEETPVIKCKDAKLNHYRNQTYNKFNPIPLASKNWLSYKSKGDYFTINVYSEDYGVPLSRRVYGTFSDTALDPSIIKILEENSMISTSQIQAEGIPAILSGKNTVLAAETGCGKTIAYLAPLVHQMLQWKRAVQSEMNSPLALIITPSRELSEQILEVTNMFKPLSINSHLILGGSVRQKMLNPSFKEIDILIATLGILNKLTTAGVYSMKNVRHVVLDEADSLLDDSFNELLVYFLKRIQFRGESSDVSEKFAGAQLTLVSATMPTSVPEILGEIIDTEYLTKIKTDKLHHIMPHVIQKFYRVGRSDKAAHLMRIMRKEQKAKRTVIIFCNNSSTCYFVSTFLSECGIDNLNFSGEINLRNRKGIFKRFQDGEVKVLIGTDIASRGLDTKHVEHVINYDFPNFASDYIHRCGRTGRLGSTVNGKVTNLISGKNEVALVQEIEMAARKMTSIEKVNANIRRIMTYKKDVIDDQVDMVA